MNAAPRCWTRQEYWVQGIPQEADSRGLGCPDGTQVGWDVSEVREAFVATPATVYGNDDDRALRLNPPCWSVIGSTIVSLPLERGTCVETSYNSHLHAQSPRSCTCRWVGKTNRPD